MTSRWAAKLVIAVPITIIVILIARTYMRNRRIDYWTLAEGSNQPNDSNAQMRILFLGNSFIHYNGGAEKVLAFQKSASTCTSNSCQHMILLILISCLNQLHPSSASHRSTAFTAVILHNIQSG